jgi:hypothetical protein
MGLPAPASSYSSGFQKCSVGVHAQSASLFQGGREWGLLGGCKMIKMIISGLAAALLAGCVTYYPYPYAVDASVSSTGETVYYTEETEDNVSYAGSVYYPWASMDYFYFGNHYYRPAASFSFSIGGYARAMVRSYYGLVLLSFLLLGMEHSLLSVPLLLFWRRLWLGRMECLVQPILAS